MKTLFLMRHAKSSWNNVALSDFERPLNERGFRAASLMAKYMQENGLVPELIICSPALRAKTTAKIIQMEAHVAGELLFDSTIYEASVGDLFAVLQNLDDAFSSVLLVGHNPGMEGLNGNLTGEFQPFPTAALAKINLEIEDWKSLKPFAGKLETIVKPREIEI